jgi:hypothetical protein
MSYSSTIHLIAAKSPIAVSLDYRDEPVGLSQARLIGRRILMPAIDLDAYSCRAVIDVVSVTFDLARRTQFRHVQRAIVPLTGRRALVTPSSPDPGGVSDVFTVILQEPTLKLLRACEARLKEQFGLVSEPVINELEVSVDFRPKTPSDAHRGRLVAVLSRHLYPNRDVLKLNTTRPRFSWGSKRSQNSFTLKRSPIKLDDGDMFVNPAGDVVPPIDATYYIGHRKVAALWRVMDKVIDRQNRDAGTWIDLPEKEKRARVEVRLDRLELKSLGMKTLAELSTLNFAQLQGLYFKFMLPTFISPTPTMDPADRHWERERVTRFLNTGVVGLRAMDDQRELERQKHRKSLTAHLRAKGKHMPPSNRRGRGQSGTFVSYVLLNDRVSVALRKLTERERRGMDGKGISY